MHRAVPLDGVARLETVGEDPIINERHLGLDHVVHFVAHDPVLTQEKEIQPRFSDHA